MIALNACPFKLFFLARFYINYLGVFEVYSSTNLVTTTPMEAISLKLSDGGFNNIKLI